MQELIIGLVFVAALIYMGRRLYRSFFVKKAGCGKGCGCATNSSVQPVSVMEKVNQNRVS